jgi:ABC-type transporter Mla maintaining outer membrane lipid asymmetry permease subunit MlaE
MDGLSELRAKVVETFSIIISYGMRVGVLCTMLGFYLIAGIGYAAFLGSLSNYDLHSTQHHDCQHR